MLGWIFAAIVSLSFAYWLFKKVRKWPDLDSGYVGVFFFLWVFVVIGVFQLIGVYYYGVDMSTRQI